MPQACKARIFDTMLMHHLLFPDLPHDLEFINSMFTQKPAWKSERKLAEELYNARDVDVTYQSWLQLKPLLIQHGLESLYFNVQIPIAKIVSEMKRTGIKVDPGHLKEVREKLIAEMSEENKHLPAELRTTTVMVGKNVPAPPGTIGKSGRPLKVVRVEVPKESCPWRSSDEVKKYLYETLKLPVVGHAKTNEPTADKGAIDKIYRRIRSGQYKLGDAGERIARGVMAIKNLRKMSTLVNGFCTEDRGKVGRVHANFNVHGTSSGRLSSSEPNLQNQPESARYIYVPSSPDWCLIEVDYSSIENRLTAWYSNDSERLRRWVLDPDFNEHRWAASVMFGIPYEDVEKDNDKDAPYGMAKRINHGTNYGMGAKKIANMNDLDFGEVKKNLEKLNKARPLLLKWQKDTGEKAKSEGVLATPFGRKRWFVPLGNYYTEALSFLPQSTAADIIFRAMIGLYYERIDWPVERALSVVRVVEPLPQPARLLLQVHDSLLFEAPSNDIELVQSCIRHVMEQPWPELGGFTIPVAMKVGKPGQSWGELK